MNTREPSEQNMRWSAFEYEKKNQSMDWYLAVGIIAVAMSVTSLLYGNLLFAVFVILGAFTLLMYTARTPLLLHMEITNTGIVVEKTLYPFQSLKSFSLYKKDSGGELRLEAKSRMAPYVHIPLSEEVDINRVQTLLAQHLEEKEYEESVSEAIMDKLGF